MDEEPVVLGIPDGGDCPECRGVGTVIDDVCQVCFAEFGEWRVEAVPALDPYP